MKISVMMEDSRVSDNFVNEFGLALHIQSNGTNILMDTATSGAFTKNAGPLGIDLRDVDMAVISHAHFDHGGGIEAFLKVNDKAKIYLKDEAKGDYYANVTARLSPFVEFFLSPLVGRSKRASRYIGLNKALFDDYPDRFVFIKESTELSDGILLVPGIPKKYPISKGNRFLLEEKEGRLQRDEFKHELILVVREEDGLVVFTGCGHNGVLNMLDAVKTIFPDSPVKGIVGGFHLKLKPLKDAASGTRPDIEAIANRIMEQKVEKVYTGHCTGKEAYDFMKNVMGEKLGRIQAGTVIEI